MDEEGHENEPAFAMLFLQPSIQSLTFNISRWGARVLSRKLVYQACSVRLLLSCDGEQDCGGPLGDMAEQASTSENLPTQVLRAPRRASQLQGAQTKPSCSYAASISCGCLFTWA